MNRIKYLTWMTYAVIVSGYIVAMGIPTGSIPGLSCVVAGLFTLVILKTVPLTHVPQLSFGLFIPILPIIAILGIGTWLLALNIKFSNNIQKGNVTSEYKTFNSISFILLLTQLVIISSNSIPFKPSLMSFIASFQIIVIFIMQMNLEYFITDG